MVIRHFHRKLPLNTNYQLLTTDINQLFINPHILQRRSAGLSRKLPEARRSLIHPSTAMDKEMLQDALCAHISQFSVNQLAWKIEQEDELFHTLYSIAMNNDSSAANRALWVCEKLSEKHPSLFAPCYDELTTRLLTCNNDTARRLLLSILFNLPVPTPLPIHLLNYCFDHLLNPQDSIAVQALCIKLVYLLCRQQPELQQELQVILGNADATLYSPGVQSAIRSTLRKLQGKKNKRNKQ